MSTIETYYALIDPDGFPLAFYCREIHGDDIPPGTVEITADQWAEFLDNQGRRKWLNGQMVEYTPPPLEQPEPVIVVPAITLWERLTEAEAEQVNAAMATQPFRTRQIFQTANTFRSDHELWPLLVQMATGLFGKERAAQLLADPSELVSNS